MNMFFLVITILWAVRMLTNILTYTHLWYIKEYRIDRMFIHLRSLPVWRFLILPPRRPPIAPKTTAVVAASAGILVFLYFVLPFSPFISLPLLDLLTFPVTMFMVILLKIPTALYHRLLIALAVRKLRRHKKMTVIGITGSYGKTSTKEILYTLLHTRYKTLKTEASKNSPIAIAELVLRDLTPQHEVFIVEMGAYKKGEIAAMCAMVLPDIGIVTAVNPQHQDLFGSIENTVEAKYELLAALGGKRIAITNGDNAFVRDMAVRARREGITVLAYTTDANRKTAEYIGTDIKTEPGGVRFSLKHKSVVLPMAVRLYGIHQVSNVLAAAAAAHAIGMPLAEIAAEAGGIRPFPKTMMPVAGIRGAAFIDDTFNNNPDAALAAIEFLRRAKGKKILVFQPMIELGSFARVSHETVAAAACVVCDVVFLTNASFQSAFISQKGKAVVSVVSPQEAASYIRSTVGKGDTVLFKGKEAARVLELLL